MCGDRLLLWLTVLLWRVQGLLRCPPIPPFVPRPSPDACQLLIIGKASLSFKGRGQGGVGRHEGGQGALWRLSWLHRAVGCCVCRPCRDTRQCICRLVACARQVGDRQLRKLRDEVYPSGCAPPKRLGCLKLLQGRQSLMIRVGRHLSGPQ